MHDTRSDDELYTQWAAGDTSAAEPLIRRRLPEIADYFANKVTTASDAEELVQETFARLAGQRGNFRGSSSFRSYLYGIAHNVLREYIKRKMRRPHGPDLGTTAIRDVSPSPSAVVARREEERLLLECLRSIPLQFQIVLEMRMFQAMSRRQIAEALDEPPGTVASRVRRALQLLDAKLEELAESAEILESTRHDIADWAKRLEDLRLEDLRMESDDHGDSG